MLAFLKEFFFLDSTAQGIADKTYRRIVEQARHPSFYRDFEVLDSVRGRFEMMTLHLFIILHRLKNEQGKAKNKAERISQKLCDLMVADMDHSLRDLKITESTVSKSFKKVIEGFYGRLSAYDRAIKNDDPRDLREVIHRNVFSEEPEISLDILDGLSEYVRDVVSFIQSKPIDDLNFEDEGSVANDVAN